jgi:LAO/AO transport system kinase
VERTVAALEMMLDLGGHAPVGWRPPIIRTVAPQGMGVPDLLDAIQRHRRFLVESGGLRARELERVRRELLEAARDELFSRCLAAAGGAEVNAMVEAVACRQLDPAAAVALLVKRAAT